MNKIEFGNYFNKMRKKNNLSLKNISETLFVSIQSINKYEKGLNYPDIALLVDIANIFNVDLDNLVNLKDNKSNNYCNNYKFDINKFSRNFNYLRKYNNLSLMQLSEKVNVQYQTISKWEKGESLPNIEQLKICADIFNVTPSQLYFAINNLEKNEIKENKNSLNYKKIIWLSSFLFFIIFSAIFGYKIIIFNNINNYPNSTSVIHKSIIKKPFEVNVSIAINFYSLDDSIEEQEKSIIKIDGKFHASKAIEYTYNNNKFKIFACESGKIIDIYFDSKWGNIIELEGINGYKYIYGSLSDIQVNKGDIVNVGDYIANAGENELHKDLGTHLHFAVWNIEEERFIDPEDYFLDNTKGS